MKKVILAFAVLATAGSVVAADYRPDKPSCGRPPGVTEEVSLMPCDPGIDGMMAQFDGPEAFTAQPTTEQAQPTQ